MFSWKQCIVITELFNKDCYLYHALYFQSQVSTMICKAKFAFKSLFFAVRSSKLENSVVWASVFKLNHKYVHSCAGIIISSKYFWYNNKQKIINQYKWCLKRTWAYVEDMFYFCSALYLNFLKYCYPNEI